MKTPIACTFFAVSMLAVAPLWAAESPWRLGIAAGYGERTNPLILSEDIPVAVDIDIAWFGKRFFFDNGDLGFTFADNALFTSSLIARINSDRVFFGKTNTRFINVGFDGLMLQETVRLEVPDRSYAVEAGFEVLTDGTWGHLRFAAHHDVSNTHEGYELDVEYGVGWRSKRWYIEPSLGMSYKSSALSNYYWGLRPEETFDPALAYEPGAGVNVRGRLLLSYYISRHWAFSLAGEYERLHDGITDSPIVRDHQTLGYFAGFRYRF